MSKVKINNKVLVHKFNVILQSIKLFVDKRARIIFTNNSPSITYTLWDGKSRRKMRDLGHEEVIRIFNERFN